MNEVALPIPHYRIHSLHAISSNAFYPMADEIEWAFNATRTAEARLGLLTLLKVFEA
jgi:hypothetical protein